MEDWMNRPEIKALDPLKLELIKKAYQQTRGKAGKNLAPVMMTLITGANRQGIRFTSNEVSLILELLKEGKSEDEKQQIDQTISMATTYLNKKKKG